MQTQLANMTTFEREVTTSAIENYVNNFAPEDVNIMHIPVENRGKLASTLIDLFLSIGVNGKTRELNIDNSILYSQFFVRREINRALTNSGFGAPEAVRSMISSELINAVQKSLK